MNRLSIIPAALAVLAAALPDTAQAHGLSVANAWVARFSALRGYEDCAYGDPSCNRCVHNVEAQFRDLTQTANHVRRVKEWEYDRSGYYGFDDQRPSEVLSVGPLGGSHFQSFVRAPMDQAGRLNLFASYGAGENALLEDPAIFAISAGKESSGQVRSSGDLMLLRPGFTIHPGGMSAIGSHLLVAHEEAGAYLEFLDGRDFEVDGPVQELDISRVANVAAARLASGGYVLLVNYSSNANNYRLYYTNSLDDPRIEPLWQNEVETTWDTGWTEGEGGFENISLVSECGSNRLFMIGATGKGVYKIAANGKWSLFEVLPGAPVLSHITNNTRHMYAPECDTRATGTAFAGPKGELALYCHQKLQDANARKDLVKCGLSVALGLFGGPAEYFCGEAVVPDTKLRFTEYWPTLGTPESTPVTTRNVTIKLMGMGIYTEGMSLGVLEGNMGSTCISDSGSNMTCTWKVPSNTAMTLIPMFDDTYDSVQWHGTTCSSRNGKAPGNRPAECSFTVGQDLTIELAGAEVI